MADGFGRCPTAALKTVKSVAVPINRLLLSPAEPGGFPLARPATPMHEQSNRDIIAEARLLLSREEELQRKLKTGNCILLPVPHESQDFKTRATHLLKLLSDRLEATEHPIVLM